MAIYLSNGYKTRQMTEAKTPYTDFEFIQLYPPQEVAGVTVGMDKTTRDMIKATLGYYIAGELKDGIRSNENMVMKSLLSIDYDNTGLTYDEFKAQVMHQLSKTNFYAFPTVSYGVDESNPVRMRLVIELDTEILDPEEYGQVVSSTVQYIGIPTGDDSNNTWAQLAGVPVVTDLTRGKGLAFHNKGNEFDWQKLLEKYPPVEVETKGGARDYTATIAGDTYTATSGRKNAIGYLLDELPHDVMTEGGTIVYKGQAINGRQNLMKAIIARLWASGAQTWQGVMIMAQGLNLMLNEPPVEDYHMVSMVKTIGEKEMIKREQN